MLHKLSMLTHFIILSLSIQAITGFAVGNNRFQTPYKPTITSAQGSDNMLNYVAPGALAVASMLDAGKEIYDAYKNTEGSDKPYLKAGKNIVAKTAGTVGEVAAVWGLTAFSQNVIGAERPKPETRNPCSVNHSMPSGHTSATTYMGARATKLLYGAQGISDKVVRYASEIAGGAIMGGITGGMRVKAEENWPQDVVVGAAYGMLPTVSNIIDENSEQIGEGLTRAANAAGRAVRWCRGKQTSPDQEEPMRQL